MMTSVSAPAKTPSLLDRQRAESAQPLCTTQRALLTLFLTAAALLFTASSLSAPAPAHRIRSADLARSIIRRRAREASASAGGEALSSSSSSSLPRMAAADLLSLRPLTSAALAVDGASAQPAAFPPPPPPAARAPAPASVADPTCHARLHTAYVDNKLAQAAASWRSRGLIQGQVGPRASASLGQSAAWAALVRPYRAWFPHRRYDPYPYPNPNLFRVGTPTIWANGRPCGASASRASTWPTPPNAAPPARRTCPCLTLTLTRTRTRTRTRIRTRTRTLTNTNPSANPGPIRKPGACSRVRQA